MGTKVVSSIKHINKYLQIRQVKRIKILILSIKRTLNAFFRDLI